MYKYRATIVSEYDGDTINVNIDLGCRIWLFDEPLRLNRINAPEVKGVERPLGLLSKAFLQSKIKVGDTIWIETQLDKTEKYGRLLADIYPEGFDGYCLNDLLVQSGFAKYYDGTGPKPI